MFISSLSFQVTQNFNLLQPRRDVVKPVLSIFEQSIDKKRVVLMRNNDNRIPVFVQFDWVEEGGCIECECYDVYDGDLVWNCEECGCGSAKLEPDVDDD